MSAPKRNLPLQSYAMERDLIAGLKKLAAREHLPIAALVRRAIRRELEREGVLKAAKVMLVAALMSSVSCVGPTQPSGVTQYECSTQERCSYPAPFYQRECRIDHYFQSSPCPATPIP